jgi:hypothetical protein
LSAIILQFGANTDRAKNAMAQLASSVASNMGTVASVMGSTALATSAATSTMGSGLGAATLAAARFIVQYRLLLGTLAAVGVGIALAAGELDALVSVGDKAAKVRLSPETFQGFVKEAERSRIAIKDAEAALQSFARANKESFDPSNEKGGTQASPLAKFLQDLVLVQRELQNSQALDRFLNADGQDAKLRATIELVRELQKTGQDLAATSLAEKAFGGAGEKIAEEIRQGRFELESVTREATAAGIIFSNDLVKRAVELRDRLEAAAREIGDNLKPFLEGSAEIALQLGSGLRLAAEAAAGLARIANNVRQEFAGVLGVVEKLGRYIPMLDMPGNIQRAVDTIDKLTTRTPASTGDALADARAKLAAGGGQALGTGAAAGGLRTPVGFDGVQLTGRNVITTTPPTRPDSTFGTGKSGGGGGKADNYDERLETVKSYIEQLEKANRLAKAEVETFGKGTVEREKALAISRLSVEATEAERKKIIELAEATGQYKQQVEELEKAKRQAAEAARYFGEVASDALIDLIVEGKSLDDVLKNIGKSLASSAIRELITGKGPFGFGTGESIFSTIGGLFGLGAKAGGGSVFGGTPYMVGEQGPELFVPGQSGTVIPNGALGGAPPSGGSVTNLSLTINAPNSTPDSVEMLKRQIPGIVMRTVAEAQRRGAN